MQSSETGYTKLPSTDLMLETPKLRSMTNELRFNATGLKNVIFSIGDDEYIIDFEKLVRDYGSKLS